ncbi:hypothetical protein A2cp1_3691 [Anaeromyxobacter dehalogenans 2CP-1]|uniref:Uncharacterized protein n=1 Tax=Anaeromyxobacter dehalogenans (strain ATCC BAA-258 / DSM 21875 / 2CP-1) TaxID=455488 RepID=B8J6P5_ANAD2|nr:hypothetical protein [Anaeromyxobacter dehalogenans]ACL67017.1 hypothetical protein A2cp1_3691 [Anaeromyxobacter dehalogenans 2CP-1]
MSNQTVLGVHLVCHANENIVELPNGRFESRRWALSRSYLKPGQLYVALHESHSNSSYRQGVLESWADDEQVPGRVVLTVRATQTPLTWTGRGERVSNDRGN